MSTPSAAGSQFTVTPHYIQAASQSASTTAENIEQQLAALKSYVVSLEEQWKGIAAGTFGSLMADYDIYSRMLHEALTGIAAGLQGNWVNYTQSEEQNISHLQAVNGTIPGGNFS
jgi:WXG100 family type VII secretion target